MAELIAPNETPKETRSCSEQDTRDKLANKSAARRSADQSGGEEEDDHLERVHSFSPPFLVRSKSRQEKQEFRELFGRQKEEKNNPYDSIRRFYERFSTSALLENKAAVARDHLANERTFLAWLRTSLTMVTVGVAITQLFMLSTSGTPPSQSHSGRAIGATFVALSILFLYIANARYFHSQTALTRNYFPASRGAILVVSACVFAVLVSMLVVILLTDHP